MWSSSNLEDTNLINRLKRHGPKIRIKIMIIIGPNRGRNQITEEMYPLMVSQIIWGFPEYNSFSHVVCYNSLFYL